MNCQTCLPDFSGSSPRVLVTNQREHIFERFTRLDETRIRDGGGSGLGLDINRDIIQRHGGMIQLGDSPPARFVIELPRQL